MVKCLPTMQETWVRSLGLGRSPGEGNGNPLQYSCLENSVDGGAWWATVHGVAESDMTERIHFHFICMKCPLNLTQFLYVSTTYLINRG